VSATVEHRGRPGHRARSVVAVGLTVFGALSLTIALLVGWAQRTVFDDREFAARTVAMLDSAAVRRALADQITSEVIARGSTSLANYRTPLTGVAEDVIASNGFRTIFRSAVEQAHRAVFERNSASALLELGETLELMAENTKTSNPSLANELPTAAGSILIDVTPTVKRLELWRFAQEAELLDEISLALAGLAFGGAIALVRRRFVFELVGVGVASAGVLLVVAAEVIPEIAARTIDDPALQGAIRAGVARFVAELSVVGLWTVPIGVIIVAAAGAGERSDRLRITAAWHWLRRQRVADLSPTGHVLLGLGLIVTGVLVVVNRHRIVSLVLLLAGGLVVYLGTVLVVRVLLGPQPEEAAEPRRRVLRPILLTAGAAIGVGVLLAGLVINVTSTRSDARSRGVLECNGHEELCDRRLDEVAFAGSHNSMSAEADPGWLFAENVYGVPAQLEYGIRALLIKSHYGIPTGINVAGVPLVVTDKQREIATSAGQETDELGPEQVATVERIDRSVGDISGRPELYLCHGYCELGATKFSEVLNALRAFLVGNPDEVVIMVIGDFVTPADTAEAFRDAGLLDHLWTYDVDKRPPTLRRMIDSGRNLFVLSEHAGGNPPWYAPAYLTKGAVIQDTPFTFASASEFSCAANRGQPDSPLFQINHWITTESPPSPKQAFGINSYRRLMGRVRECERQRDRFPTIIGVNFYDHGDLLEVVDDLNQQN
jgi:hypothetical protein